MAKPVVLHVHEGTIQGFLLPGGEVYGAVRGVIVDARTYARAFAPVRTGRLRRNIRHADPADRPGPYQITGYVYANIGYAHYVEEGTTGPIRSKSGKTMHFRGNKGMGNFVAAEQVSGQRGQHYMRAGLNAAIRTFKVGG